MFKLLIGYIIWWKRSKNLHGIHSPFIFSFVKNCLYSKDELWKFKNIEEIRNELLINHKMLTFTDYGAGSAKCRQNELGEGNMVNRKISQIAKNSLQQKKYCRLLYRFVNYFQVNSILEIGTSLGITTSYLAIANTSSVIHTIEGAKAIAEQAQRVFDKQNLKNISLINKTFEDYFQSVATDLRFDFIIIDGNHRGDATLKYFQHIIQHKHSDTVVIIDDIRWSKSMYEAWCNITQNSEVTATIDLFKMGIVFFNKKLSKENFKIRF